ncbi:response regulator [Halodurantibacterium flavum]|uniref:Response regulator n=1 Tax=Halodurantibacterium flavum TaxID=1382802 RepID=A0ABW4S5Y5_9RHOB
MAVIIVADDEFLLAQMLADLLEDEGYEVHTAQNGARALELVRSHQPALLITDFMMPVMTGLELATHLRDDPLFETLPILLVSGAQGALAREREDLFDRVLDKPYNHLHLKQVVAEMVAP